MSTVKRLFFYTVAIINLGIFAWGIGTLLTLVFDLLFGATDWKDYAQVQLSLGLAMLVIGGALWFIFWRIIQKQTADKTAEIGSGIRKLYINLVLTITSITAFSTFAGFIGWAIAGTPYRDFQSGLLAAFIVSGCLWLYHSMLERTEGQPSSVSKTLRRWYIYILTSFGLISLVVSVIQAFNTTILFVFNLDTIRSGFWHGGLAPALAWVITGSIAWWYFWFREARDDYDSTLRQVYLYLLTITGGAVAALVSLTNIFYEFLSGVFSGFTDTFEFDFLAWAVPTALITGGVWFYHRKIVREESEKLTVGRLSPRRLYLYLMSFIGLGAMLSGIMYLFSVLFYLIFDSVTTATVFTSDWWGNQLSLSLSLLLVGVPVWLYCWRQILRMAGAGGAAERGARSRRIYLYAVLGISIIAAVTTLVIVIYQVISAILQGDFDSESLRNIIWSLSILLTAIPVMIYHWRVLREDQSLGAEKVINRKKVSVVAGAEADELVARIEEALGYRVRKMKYTGEVTGQNPVLTDDEMEALATAIGEAAGDGVILDITEGMIKLLPFEGD